MSLLVITPSSKMVGDNACLVLSCNHSYVLHTQFLLSDLSEIRGRTFLPREKVGHRGIEEYLSS